MSYPDHKSLANLTLRMHSNEQKSEKLQINFGRQRRKQNVQSEEYMVSKKIPVLESLRNVKVMFTFLKLLLVGLKLPSRTV